MKRIAVIGGGLGGLASAITLAHAGMEVHLFEKNHVLGGKMRAIQMGTHHFDFGPNTITMRAVFQQVLAQTGVNPDDYLVEQLTRISPEDAKNYEAFITEISRLYFLAQQHFLQTTFMSWKDYLKPSLLRAIVKVRPFETLEQFLRGYFTHPFILQCFLRYATYIGSSPYAMPATFAMIAYLELVEGVDYVKRGTSAIAKAYARRAKELGVTIHLGCEITEIKSSRSKLILNKLRSIGIDLDGAIVEEKVVTAQFLANEFNAYRGALYGAASNSVKSAFFRPSNRHVKLKNLFFVGGTVHPGGGSPLVTLGGMNVAKQYLLNTNRK